MDTFQLVFQKYCHVSGGRGMGGVAMAVEVTGAQTALQLPLEPLRSILEVHHRLRR